MTCSMVFQSSHGRLNYGSMPLDRDVAYFNFTFIKSMQCYHITLKSLVSFQIFKKKKKHMLGMNLKLNQYSTLLSMCFIRYGSTFIQQLCWVVCVSFCKNKVGLQLCFISLCNSHNW